MSFVSAKGLITKVGIHCNCAEVFGNVRHIITNPGWDHDIIRVELDNDMTIEMMGNNPVYIAIKTEIDRQIADDELERKIVKIVRRELDIALYNE